MYEELDLQNSMFDALNDKWKGRGQHGVYPPPFEVVARTSTGFIIRETDKTPYKTFEVSIRVL